MLPSLAGLRHISCFLARSGVHCVSPKRSCLLCQVFNNGPGKWFEYVPAFTIINICCILGHILQAVTAGNLPRLSVVVGIRCAAEMNVC